MGRETIFWNNRIIVSLKKGRKTPSILHFETSGHKMFGFLCRELSLHGLLTRSQNYQIM